MKNEIRNANMVKNSNPVSMSAHETGRNITKKAFLAMYLMCLSYSLYCRANTTTVSETFEKEQHVYQMQNLNPVVPGYAADAS
ncbi:MAG: hypothetical protein LBH77_10130, partial [Tannerella sp.]|nr:hypothetical protein [Tannerella sp.]